MDAPRPARASPASPRNARLASPEARAAAHTRWHLFRKRRAKEAAVGGVLVAVFFAVRAVNRMERAEERRDRRESPAAESRERMRAARERRSAAVLGAEAQPRDASARTTWEGSVETGQLRSALERMVAGTRSGFGPAEKGEVLDRAGSMKRGESADFAYDVQVGGSSSRLGLALFALGEGRFDLEVQGPEALVRAFTGDDLGR